MDIAQISQQDRRRVHLSRPVLVLAAAALAVLAGAVTVLVGQFDSGERAREQQMVTRGWQIFADDMTLILAPRVNSDAAVQALDRGPGPGHVDKVWADRELPGFMEDAIGADRVVVFDAGDRLAWDSRDASTSAAYRAETRPMIRAIAAMLPDLRATEAARAPLAHPSDHIRLALPPITASSFVMIHGELHILLASLVQPDAGQVLPRGARAPVVAALLPVNRGVLRFFSGRYLIRDLRIASGDRLVASAATIPVRADDGTLIAYLAWTPRTPGTDLLVRLAPLLLLGLVPFVLVSWRFARQSSTIAADLIASEAHARHLAFHDTLTQLPNRALMFDRLRAHIATLQRSAGTVAVHCLDLDRFKEVNDTLGHQAGDELIQKVCARLLGMCRETDTVARLGGDEFVILQPATNAAGASHLAERVLAAFTAPFELAAGTVEVGCSVGVTLVDNPALDANEALRQADMSLYGSKENGRNRVTFFEPDMDAALRMRRSLEVDLRAALHSDGLSMVYQPQVDSRGKAVSMEALVRWHHPDRGSVPPGIFVPLAEESGLILELGEFVFRRVFAETRHWQDMHVAVNVSALQLRSLSFMAMLTRLVAENGIDPAMYEIEITETALLGDDNVTRDNITMLKQEGFSIALDDFGTGYSSLSSLQRFAVDKIKIDRSFVRNLAADEEAEALVDAIVKLGRALKLDIVAEGVETELQRERLLHCGCTQFQGFLMSRPVPAAEIERLFV